MVPGADDYCYGCLVQHQFAETGWNELQFNPSPAPAEINGTDEDVGLQGLFGTCTSKTNTTSTSKKRETTRYPLRSGQKSNGWSSLLSIFLHCLASMRHVSSLRKTPIFRKSVLLKVLVCRMVLVCLLPKRSGSVGTEKTST